MENKKAMSSAMIAILIAVVLGVIVLVIMSGGFSKTWNNLFGRITSYAGDDLSNVEQTCKIASDAGNSRALTSTTRTVKDLSDSDLEKARSIEGVTIKDKTASGITCAQLKDKGLISY